LFIWIIYIQFSDHTYKHFQPHFHIVEPNNMTTIIVPHHIFNGMFHILKN